MKKSTFKITGMDCPSEEQMIRMKLEDLDGIRQFNFNLDDRTLVVFHDTDLEVLKRTISQLKLGDKLLNSEVTSDFITSTAANQKKILWAVLLINFFFFVAEIISGFIANSLGLIADSLDMLADASVYGLSLFAVGGTLVLKKKIARFAGYVQILLAIIGFVEVIRRFIGMEKMPEFKLMIFVSLLALIGNSICIYLLQKARSHEAHIRASMIFTANDILINLGVIIAGLLVLWLNSGIPDLIIGAVVFVLVLRGAVRILRLGQ